MANLIKLSNDLEYVPKEQLIEMSQNPNNNYPSYLVLAEIQRRTQMEKMYAAQQPQPETTVAEELVQEYASSPQGLGAMAQTPGANPSTLGAEGNMAPPSPMQAMASGGRTGYQVGGQLTTEELKNQFLQSQGIGGDSLSQTFTNPMTEELSNEELQKTKSILDRLPRNADGSIDKSAIAKAIGTGVITAASVAAVLIPEPTTSAIGAARLGTMGYGSNLLQLPGKIKSGIQGFMGRRALSKDPTKRFGPENTKGLKPLQSTKQVGAKEISNLKIPTRAAGLIGLGVAGNMINDNIEEEINNEDITKTAEQLEIDRLNALLAEMKNKDVETVDTSEDRRNADMLVGLGGAIGSARNLGELSSGISDAYFNVQSKRDANKLAGLQGRMAELQIEKAETELANMPEQRLIQQYGFIQDAIDDHNSGESILDEATLANYIKQKSLLLEQIMAYGNVAQTGGEMGILQKTKIPA